MNPHEAKPQRILSPLRCTRSIAAVGDAESWTVPLLELEHRWERAAFQTDVDSLPCRFVLTAP